MEISNILKDYAPLAVIAYLVFKDIRSGRSQISAEAQNNYKAVHEQDKETIAELKSQLRKAEEGCIATRNKLEGELKAKDESIARQQAIIENRNPELLEILKANLEINTKVADFMEKLNARMDKNEGILNIQTEMLQTGQDRNKKIDEATANETGHVLRKK